MDLPPSYLSQTAGCSNLHVGDRKARHKFNMCPVKLCKPCPFCLRSWFPDLQVLTVRVIDECPCSQELPVGAPGTGGGTTRKQEWCCGSQNHFDLSYW